MLAALDRLATQQHASHALARAQAGSGPLASQPASLPRS
jgi:hypothetical protein